MLSSSTHKVLLRKKTLRIVATVASFYADNIGTIIPHTINNPNSNLHMKEYLFNTRMRATLKQSYVNNIIHLFL